MCYASSLIEDKSLVTVTWWWEGASSRKANHFALTLGFGWNNRFSGRFSHMWLKQFVYKFVRNSLYQTERFRSLAWLALSVTYLLSVSPLTFDIISSCDVIFRSPFSPSPPPFFIPISPLSFLFSPVPSFSCYLSLFISHLFSMAVISANHTGNKDID